MTLDGGGFVGMGEGGDELDLDDGGLVGSVDSTRDVGGLVGEAEGGG